MFLRLGDSRTLLAGLLPQVVHELVNRRGAVKKQLKTEREGTERAQQLNIKQLALKLVANSMYGCLGFPHSRFFAMALAELITLKVRSRRPTAYTDECPVAHLQ
jgi:DNA polymerase alpha subunit A